MDTMVVEEAMVAVVEAEQSLLYYYKNKEGNRRLFLLHRIK
jgi:hypothetical protein